MNHLTTDLIEALAQKQDIEEVFRHHLETAINQLLKHELTVFLDYEPYDREGFHPAIPVMATTIVPLKPNTENYTFVSLETVMASSNNKQ